MDKLKCPVCGGTEVGEGRFSADLTPTNKVLAFGSRIFADVCIECGTIVKLKIMDPGRFKDEK